MADNSKIVRQDRHANLMAIAHTISRRGECRRRQVGAVIVDCRGRILSTGVNGVAPGQTSCIDEACPGAGCASGKGLDLCEASHAEISALVTLEKPFEAYAIYCTTAPCISCVKAILLTSINTIFYSSPYPVNGMELWRKNGRGWCQL